MIREDFVGSELTGINKLPLTQPPTSVAAIFTLFNRAFCEHLVALEPQTLESAACSPSSFSHSVKTKDDLIQKSKSSAKTCSVYVAKMVLYKKTGVTSPLKSPKVIEKKASSSMHNKTLLVHLVIL